MNKFWALLLCGCASAQATTYDLGALVPGEVYTLTEDNLVGRFDDLITFTTANYQPVAFSFIDPNVFGLTVTAGGMTNGPVEPQVFNAITGSGGFDFQNGSSFLELSGVGGATHISLNGGRTFVPGSLTLEVTTTPEPETWAVMLIGAGLMTWRLRRARSLDQMLR